MAMTQSSPEEAVDEIAWVTGSRPLASAIHRSVASALACPFVCLHGGGTELDVFRQSLHAAIRDIERHPRGRLFQRLIEFGPHNPDDPKSLTSDGATLLSDPECGSCVEFIYSHMINRFKGELAELLALEPCISLLRQRQAKGDLPPSVELYWGELVRERRQVGQRGLTNPSWGSFAKGADGLVVEQMPGRGAASPSLMVYGIIEVKSMPRPQNRVLEQINHHMARLRGGLQLEEREYSPGQLALDPHVIRIMVVPSTWKLSRECSSAPNASGGRTLIFPEPGDPPVENLIAELEPRFWKITLAWSEEALNQAAYEMTFWYMSQVGKHVYTGKPMPAGWESMTPEEAGYNAIKMMLYYMPLRPISKRQERLAIRLYNVYSFGYPLGAGSREMLWPEDIPGKAE